MNNGNANPNLTVVTEDNRKALTRARIDMMSATSLVFFTTLVFNMEQYWDDQIDDYETDGLTYSLNPDYFMNLNKMQRVYVLGKIALHTSLLHPIRMLDHERPLWERAATNVANLELQARHLIPPPNEEAQARFTGMSVEQVYKILRDEQQKSNSNSPSDSPNHLQPPGANTGPDSSKANNDGSQGGQNKVEGMTATDIASSINDLIQQAVSAAQQAGEPGSIPGNVSLELDKLNSPKLPWHVILQRWMNRFDKTDYSLRKPNRRFMPEFLLPSLYSNAMIRLAIAVDISGSVSDADFKEIIGHVGRIAETVKPEYIELIQFDTQLQEIDRIRSKNDLYKVNFHGRGGTDVSPVLDWADKHKPEGLIFFSDGGFYHPRESCKHDVLWLTHNNPSFTAPYGKVIHYEMTHGKGYY